MQKTRIQVIGNAIVITVVLLLSTFKKVARANPKALVLMDEDKKNELFRINTGKSGSISEAGMIFDGTDVDGNMRCTTLLPEGITTEDQIKDTFLAPFAKLTKLVEQIENAGNEIDALTETVFAEMEVE